MKNLILILGCNTSPTFSNSCPFWRYAFLVNIEVYNTSLQNTDFLLRSSSYTETLSYDPITLYI